MMRIPFFYPSRARSTHSEAVLPVGKTPMAPPSGYDILHRLDCNMSGPDIHVSYYRRDSADAATEIRALRSRIATLEMERDAARAEVERLSAWRRQGRDKRGRFVA